VTFAPASIVALQTFWQGQGGVALGIVGNQKHCAGYHLGKDRIYGDCACRPDGTCEPGQKGNDYSVQLPRDKSGLSNAASAIDLGRLDGALASLRSFSRWLVTACQADRVRYRDIREVIYSPDGVKVQRYSGVDGLIHTGAGNGDGSHTTHTHISFFRDSVGRDKVALFAPYFVSVPDTSTGDTVKSFAVYEQRTFARIADLAVLYDNSGLAASPGNVKLSPSRELVYVGTFSPEVRIVAYEGMTPDADGSSKAMFVKAMDILSTRPENTTALVSAAYNDGLAAAAKAVAAVPKR
jgi:hypothetical protein